MRNNNKKLLYLGLDPSRLQTTKEIVHYPIIMIEPYPLEGRLQKQFLEALSCSIILLTSRVAATLFFTYYEKLGIKKDALMKKIFVAVGRATAELLPHAISCQQESAEGMVALLEQLQPLVQGRSLFYPHSEWARSLLRNYLEEKKFSYVDAILYKPKVVEGPLPYDLEEFDEIVFTSSSTVHAFFSKKPSLPKRLLLTTRGEITQNTLLHMRAKYC